MHSRMLKFGAALLLLSVVSLAQESRGSITGVVTDPQSAVIPGATVVITNTETNVSNRTQTNPVGYFEVNLLNPGMYSVTVEVTGFKKTVRSGLELLVAGRLDIRVQLEIGQPTQTIEVTAEAPLLDTTTASGGRVIGRRDINELPFQSMNPFALTAISAGMQYTGSPDDQRWFDHAGTSNYNTMGNVGSNEFTIDGAPVTGTAGRVGFAPTSEAVEEFRLETTPFDSSYGHTAGAVVNVVSKSGANAYHGSLYDQHWQQRWNAMPLFTGVAYRAAVASGKKNPNDPKQASGRYNQFGAALGGPFRIPKVIDGRNKLFFFLTFGGIRQNMTEVTSNQYTVPKMSWRQGDFSDLLAVDAVKYTVYDPRSARSVSGRVVRTPFPGNKGVPILNPAYDWWIKLYPEPNNVPGLVMPDGTNNWYAAGQPKIDKGNNFLNRVDYNISDKHRLYGKWYWNDRHSNEYDWAYSTPRAGLMSNGLLRPTRGASGDYIWSISATNMLNIGVNFTRFSDGASAADKKVQLSTKPSELGLPNYIDQKAGDYTQVPDFNISNIASYAGARGSASYPYLGTAATTDELKAGMTTILRSHSLKYGWSERRYYYALGGPGLTTGTYVFNNTYFRQQDNTTTASNLGLAWAAFLMGLPATASIDTNDSSYWGTRYRALYLQDDWRVSSRLRFGFGVRYEHETGISERFNRGLGGDIDWSYRPPFAAAVEAAYAKNPVPELAASQFKVIGGTSYLGQPKKNFTGGYHHLAPNVSMVYQLNSKTVLRTGYGWFFGNAAATQTTRPGQNGYSKNTLTTVSNDNGLTFCCLVGDAASLGAGRTPLNDPFPVRSDGTRFDAPLGNSLGPNILQGSGFTINRPDIGTPWQQRWRLSVQREISKDVMIDVSYNGSYARSPGAMSLSYLPQQYWATGNLRNNTVESDLTKTFANPFNTANLADLRMSDPKLYQFLSTVSRFTGTTMQKQQLLRAYPNFSSLTGVPQGADPKNYDNQNKYHDLEVQFDKRFSHGFNSGVVYTRAYGVNTYRQNEFDQQLSWQPNNSVVPHRIAWTAVFELPFGKGRKWVTESPLQHIVGGWQLSWIYQYQSGTASTWSNQFFYGDIDKIGDAFKHDETFSKDVHQWFDPSIRYTTGAAAIPSGFVGFEGRSAFRPGTYHVRTFPSILDALRVDGVELLDLKVARMFRIHEQANVNFSLDLMNALNHTNFGAPNTDPTSTDFGRVSAQRGNPRQLKFNLRIEF